ncbi:hypothetical protein [Caldimonas brevitalea]|uniref:Uncharacterized protein n=1 Tax=Caldimonas brevitalea TaxID=413882 RepID=A0A0G3BGK9_9BURK|nr:hypothetical protein [Caldimonas brevitalea]AKJ27118.1 hypothetical protein AAW51_0427 [Caldimonas brevitalea]
MIRHSTDEVLRCFSATRLGSAPGIAGSLLGTMGMPIAKTQAGAIVERAYVIH